MKIIKPNIFGEYKILSGVTTRNLDIFPDYGFSIGKAEILDDTQVIEMRQYLADFLNIKYENMIFQKQIHSDIISVVDNNYIYSESDAMITNLYDKVLVLSLADCAGILLYDDISSSIAAIHSGWRSSVLNITSKTIRKMNEVYNSKPENIRAFISPLASSQKYEIGEDIYDKVKEFTEIRNNKFYFDNRKMLFFQLKEVGVLPHNIEISDNCTITNQDLHSYRRDKNRSGRMAAFIGITK